MRACSLVLGLLIASPAAFAQEEPPPATWAEYQAANTLSCNGSGEALPAPEVKQFGGFEYSFSGPHAKVRRLGGRAVPGEVRLGVLSGIKELDRQTKEVLTAFFERFKAEKVEGVILGGDNAENESDLEDVFAWIAEVTELPVYVVIGNWEGRAPFNRALRNVSKEHPNLLNLDFIRRLDAEGFDLISLGGYFDSRYLKGHGCCLYKPQDVEALAGWVKQADDPVILLVHGPPQQKGKEAIDFVPGFGNVGDPALAKLVAETKIPFGIHGHILEAGGRATDAKGSKLVPGKLLPQFFLNPGPASALPWKMNDGKTGYGMAALVTLQGKLAKFEILRAPKPKDEGEQLIDEAPKRAP